MTSAKAQKPGFKPPVLLVLPKDPTPEEIAAFVRQLDRAAGRRPRRWGR